MMPRVVRRLIEVDLPIKRISAHASREKSIRHGHISTLHVWWARRPLAACRAVICASLWPDPADPHCPQIFRIEALKQMVAFAKATQSNRELSEICEVGSWKRFMRLAHGLDVDLSDLSGQVTLRAYLLDFIADFAAWEAATNCWFLDTARSITRAAHEALVGDKDGHPLVIDPFAGGGSIPLEALRVGASVFASDLNPVAVLLNKIVVEYVPRHGEVLSKELKRWGKWVEEKTRKELARYFPGIERGGEPVAYLWARTIRCEGPACGVRVPIIRSLTVAQRGRCSISLVLSKGNDGQVSVSVKDGAAGTPGTVKRGAVTCPICGYTTPVTSVRKQLSDEDGGADSSRLLAVVERTAAGKTYRSPTTSDLQAANAARQSYHREQSPAHFTLPLMSGVFNAPIYGMRRWDLLFSARQLLVADALQEAIEAASLEMAKDPHFEHLRLPVKVLLLCAFDKHLDFRSTLCGWISKGEKIGHTFGRQALGMIFDWVEGTPFSDMSGSWGRSIEYLGEFLDHLTDSGLGGGSVERSPAQQHVLPDDSVNAVVTDPPYYNAVPYADLSDFFYPWLRKSLRNELPALFNDPESPKKDELCEMAGWDPDRYADKDSRFYEMGMKAAFAEARRVCSPAGIGVVVFAHKTTVGWETLLSALMEAGWIITGSWPIDTERSGRLRAMGSAALASSVHLVCRPREDTSGNVISDDTGDWRDVLTQLPIRIREWMVRLSNEGVVGADAIFACLGPALEIFSRYSRVEKASGEPVALKEYLTYVWGAVAQEALAQIFQDADATGFEEDARLTAMWLWTMNAGGSTAMTSDSVLVEPEDTDVPDAAEDEDGSSPTKGKGGGFVLEFDAARKIAQGLGAHLEQLSGVIEVKGDKARLLSVAERTKRLFGKHEADAPQQAKRKRKDKQMKLFGPEDLGELEAEEGGWGDKSAPKLGDTTLDRVHQSMILFAAGRGEALRRFLVDDGAGKDQRFWKLANALSALYPPGTDEKRWVDGVLARKKGLGL